MEEIRVPLRQRALGSAHALHGVHGRGLATVSSEGGDPGSRAAQQEWGRTGVSKPGPVPKVVTMVWSHSSGTAPQGCLSLLIRTPAQLWGSPGSSPSSTNVNTAFLGMGTTPLTQNPQRPQQAPGCPGPHSETQNNTGLRGGSDQDYAYPEDTSWLPSTQVRLATTCTRL